MLPHFPKLVKSATEDFARKKFSEDIPTFVIDTVSNSNWTSCGTIQGVIVLVISNRPDASPLSDFEITCVNTSRIVLHSVQFANDSQSSSSSFDFKITRFEL